MHRGHRLAAVLSKYETVSLTPLLLPQVPEFPAPHPLTLDAKLVVIPYTTIAITTGSTDAGIVIIT